MEYTTLGGTELKVSRICLGTVFRSEADEATCLAAIEEAAASGCNFLDCANVYRDGFSEQIVGKAIRGRRDQFVVTTKVGAPASADPASGGLSRAAIMREVEASLTRLKTDYIDLYLCHHPDPVVPIEETLHAMNDLVRQGKVRYAGCSNFEAWRLCEANCVSEREHVDTFVCNQVLYNLLDRRIEDELIPYCRARKIGITVFAATAIGLLTGRYRVGQPPPPGTTWHRGPYNYRAAMTPRTGHIIETLMRVAAEHDKSPSQVAMAWCLGHPGVTSVITGADTPERVRENCGAAGWQLSADGRACLDAASEGIRLIIRKDCPDGYKPEDT